MALPVDTCGNTLPTGTPVPDSRDTAFPSCGGSGLRGTQTRAVGGTGRPLGRTFFLHRQGRHPELPQIPTYLSQFKLTVHHIQGIKNEMADYISRKNFDAFLGESSEALAKEAFQRMDVQLDLPMRTAAFQVQSTSRL